MHKKHMSKEENVPEMQKGCMAGSVLSAGRCLHGEVGLILRLYTQCQEAPEHSPSRARLGQGGCPEPVKSREWDGCTDRVKLRVRGTRKPTHFVFVGNEWGWGVEGNGRKKEVAHKKICLHIFSGRVIT